MSAFIHSPAYAARRVSSAKFLAAEQLDALLDKDPDTTTRQTVGLLPDVPGSI
ncbi:hypothetical protein ACIPL1_24540 [Pseudomonas sp. NPDC090202]|uniref:hypothetical protein n=1 Tax=unclassified Pseudomonas TaxID=196821 RepID=UPI00382D7A7A